MRKVKIIVVFSILICTFLSCSNGFLKDPRLYNPKRNLSTMTVAPEPELQLTGGVDPFDDTEKWYNKSDSNGDENNKERNDFKASEFDNLQIEGWFDKQNVPTYTMKKGDVWKAGDATKHEYVHSNAPNTSGQGYNITGVTYYQYRGINPNYDPVGNYNTSLQTTEDGKPKLSRFYFYRFTGYGGSIQWLDNYLIAVDTYSKLIFAFSEPVEFSTMGAPTRWDPTDNEAFIGQMYQFYMYDPVGYVEKKDDSSYNVVLYQWFKDNLAKGVYEPTLGGVDRSGQGTSLDKIASKEPDGAGKSPFNNHTADFFVENMKLLAGTPFYRREMKDGVNGLVLYKYMVSEDGKTITRTAENWNGLATDTDLHQRIYNVGEESTATKGNVTGEYSGELELELAENSYSLKFGNGEVAVSNFTDLGPDWLERVKHGPTYKRGSVSYQFSEGGKKLIYTDGSKSYNYDFIKQNSSDERNFAIYWTDDASASWMGIGYAGFGLYNDDYIIKVTNTSAGGENLVDWLVMKDEASLEGQVTDSFASNLKGKTFSLRKKDSDGLYGLSLTTYSFGNTNIKEELDWYTGKETSQQTVTVTDTNKLTGNVDGKQATLTMPEDGNWTLTINGETYYRNYSDPGPSFLHRVKGKYFSGPYLLHGTNYYVFSDDGKTLYYYYQTSGDPYLYGTYSWTGKNTDTHESTYNNKIYRFEDEGTTKDHHLKYPSVVGYDVEYKGPASTFKFHKQ